MHARTVDGYEIQRVPDQRQNELLAEFERRKKASLSYFETRDPFVISLSLSLSTVSVRLMPLLYQQMMLK